MHRLSHFMRPLRGKACATNSCISSFTFSFWSFPVNRPEYLSFYGPVQEKEKENGLGGQENEFLAPAQSRNLQWKVLSAKRTGSQSEGLVMKWLACRQLPVTPFTQFLFYSLSCWQAQISCSLWFWGPVRDKEEKEIVFLALHSFLFWGGQ